MPRIAEADPSVYEPVFGPEATTAQKVFANSPEIAAAQAAFGAAVRRPGLLPFRLVELVRIRVAFHNQCRSCMAMRYADLDGTAIDEGLVCSLEKPQEADDLSEPERAALAFADKLATDHLSIDDSTFDRLREHFTNAEIMELGFRVASAVGFGRLTAVLEFVPDDLPEEMRGEGEVAPWQVGASAV